MAGVPAASQALAILKLLARQAAPMPAAAIARELSLPRSKTYNLLTALADEGFVVHLPERQRFGLGVAAFELGSAYSRQEPLRWIAAPTLAQLVAAVGHNGHFAVLHGRDVLYVLEERAVGRPSLVTDVGVRLPATLTASGLSMLAALPAHQLQALFSARGALILREGRGPRTLTELRALVAQTRRAGFAVEDGAVTAGFASVAAAVLDHRRYPIASVALTFPVEAVPADAQRRALAGQVREAADRISRAVGRSDGPAADPNVDRRSGPSVHGPGVGGRS